MQLAPQPLLNRSLHINAIIFSRELTGTRSYWKVIEQFFNKSEVVDSRWNPWNHVAFW